MVSVCLFFMFVLIFLVAARGMKQEAGDTKQNLRAVRDGWYYMENGEKVTVQLPAILHLSPGETLELRNDEVSTESADAVILTWGAQYDLQMFADGKEIYQYQEYGFARNLQMKRKLECRAQLPETKNDLQLILRYRAAQDGICEVKPVYIGSSEEVFSYQITNAAPVLGIVFVMFVLCTLALGIYIYLRHNGIREKRFISVGMFLLLCGIWCITDSSLIQYLGAYSPVINEISFYAFMLMTVPVIRFVQETEGMGKYRSVSVLQILFYLNVILQSICNYWLYISMIAMLVVTHILLTGGCILLILLLYREYEKEKSRQVKAILMAFGILALSGVVSLVLYWIFGITGYDLIFEVGILIFVTILLWGLGMAMVDNMRFRTEAQVYKKLAQEDQLTGMKNRFAYEKILEDLENGVCDWENAVLIYMDLNHLKEVNDLYGHGAGDELLIAAAQSIQKAYGSLGYCFRIGGDEFCAILPGQGEAEEILSGKLDEAIREYNDSGERELSIARGFSWLKDNYGMRKRISDWKFEADQKMYKNKGWYRREELQEKGGCHEV